MATTNLCSFCGKQGQRRKMAGGLGALICLDCLDFHHTQLHSRKKVVASFDSSLMSDEEMLAHLPLILKTVEQNMAFAHEWVAIIRERKISWAEVGKVLGVSRQAAWERFSRPDKKSAEVVVA